MSDRFRPLALAQLVGWIADELEIKDSIFGIPRGLFFTPDPGDPFRTEVYGQTLENPLGVAAGPHSQLAQNIVVSWLCGARFIELKTVQTLDELEIPKPCIDMQDEGFNVEWSQELKVEESFREYLNAWVIIHALHRRLGLPGDSPGVIFNLSVGYDLAGIRRPNMQLYLDRMENAGEDLEQTIEAVARRFPEVTDIAIPARLSDNVTLSTMHGCPPGEIGSIVEYLLGERGLHCSVKLNPTLLGAERVRRILNDRLGYADLVIPDTVFTEDLAYPEALTLIENLVDKAARLGLEFGVKLTNTLAVANHRRVFDPAESTMYLSGRPLHALTVHLAQRLAEDLGEPPLMSFSGGADALNTPSLLRSGMRTVTVCSDILRPGGYLRLRQYLENIADAMRSEGTQTIEDFILSGTSGDAVSVADASRHNLRSYAKATLSNPAFHRQTYDRQHTKTRRRLDLFDCIEAPCTDICDVDQNVPEYMRRVRDGDLIGAAAITRDDNPLASILGRTCHHPCEPVCLRTHMDQPLAIREIKRFITDHEPPLADTEPPTSTRSGVAVIGGGPCGLGAATFLARAGHPVTIFEARAASGGMVSATIPGYRAPARSVDSDLDRIVALGVEIRHGQEVGKTVTLESLGAEGYRSIVVAIGARQGLRLGLDGEDAAGVIDGLAFLRTARSGNPPELGQRIGVIGGGDVAMDCARSACRLGGGEVTVYYRRTRAEMPAQKEEIQDLLEEGGALTELVAPRRLVIRRGRLEAVEMAPMRLGEPDDSGRRRPVEVEEAGFVVPLDTLIVAIGQRPDLSLFGEHDVALTESGYLAVHEVTLETSVPGVYAGGDIIGIGPESIVKACGDGRKIAEAIIAREDGRGPNSATPGSFWPAFDATDLLRRRSRIEPRVAIPHRPFSGRGDFAEVIDTLDPETARTEASRCLDCDLVCSTCEGVCPNRAILTYSVEPAVLSIPVLRPTEDGEIKVEIAPYRITQGPQVAVLSDACNECGNCVTFCPTADRPWSDKPRLYFDRRDFEAQSDNAFMFLVDGSSRGLQARFGGACHELFEVDGGLRYLSPTERLLLDSETLVVREIDLRRSNAVDGAATADRLGAMVTLLRSFARSMPEFPLIGADPEWLLTRETGRGGEQQIPAIRKGTGGPA
jgi:putative selenate reductase